MALGYGASRKMSNSGYESDGDSAVKSLFVETFELPNAHDWLLQTDYAAKSGKGAAAARLEQIKDVLAHPETGVLPDVNAIRFAEQEGDYAPPQVEFHSPYGWVTLDQLSLGYRTMIAWVVDLARRLFERYPEMENPLEGPAICLVDEIDLHLHPTWQRKITGFLSTRFPNTQFIATAHSPLVVQALPDEANVAVLKQSDEPEETGARYVKILNDMKPAANLRVDQILTSELYGLASARPPQVEEHLKERRAILQKSELSPDDRARLDELEAEIGDLPAGETEEEREAMEFIQRVGKRLGVDE